MIDSASEARGADAVEITALFDDTVLEVHYLTDPRTSAAERPRQFTLGDSGSALFPSALFAGSFPLVHATGSDWELCFTRALSGEVESGGARRTLAELVGAGSARLSETVAGAHAYPLERGARVRVNAGANTFLITKVSLPSRSRTRAPIDWVAHAYTAAVGLAAALFLLMANAIPPEPSSLSLGDLLSNPRIGVWLIKPVTEEVHMPSWLIENNFGASPSGGKRAAATESAAGKSGAAPRHTLLSVKGPVNNPTPALAKKIANQRAADSGILSILRAGETSTIGSIFGREDALGDQARTAMGNLGGVVYGEAAGHEGLGLFGKSGPGGDGAGPDTVGFGPWGRIGHGGLMGGGHAGGAGGLHDRRPHALPDVLRCDGSWCTAHVVGSLDKSIVRRVVRSHMQEVRYCYERELQAHPELFGRVSAQFTISAVGTVMSAAIQSSTLGSAPVEKCIAEAVRRWSFPKPEGGGIVIVSYPFVLKTAGSE